MLDRRADGGATVCGPECRHELFAAARRRAELSVTQLWVRYLSLGGNLDLFSIEAYLHGMTPLPPAQQDVLANALNEQLADLFEAARVPYLHNLRVQGAGFPGPASEDPLAVLDALLRPRPPDQPDQP